jgi:hypothetical protein
LLNQLNDALLKANAAPFIPHEISRIGGFYLPSGLQSEDEVRLMIKRYKEGRSDAQSDGSHEYWPIPIGVDNEFCRIDVLEIHPGPNAKRTDIEAAVAGTPLETIPIV